MYLTTTFTNDSDARGSEFSVYALRQSSAPEVCGSAWKCTEVHGSAWKRTKVHGSAWKRVKARRSASELVKLRQTSGSYLGK